MIEIGESNNIITLLALGTSSCRAFILSAILSLRNCNSTRLRKIQANTNEQLNRKQMLVFLFCFVWLVRKKKQRENCELMTYSFSDGVWIGGLTSPGPDSGSGLRRRCPSRAAHRSLVHRSGWSSIILGLK